MKTRKIDDNNNDGGNQYRHDNIKHKNQLKPNHFEKTPFLTLQNVDRITARIAFAIGILFDLTFSIHH